MIKSRGAALLFAAVGAASVGAQPVPSVPFDAVFQWVRFVELQQNDQVLAVSPRISRDPLGGWLAVDAREGQVRLHTEDGALTAFFGRQGEGPGEFSSLSAVLRAESGDLVTVDGSGRIARWSRDGSNLLREFRVPLLGISAAEWFGSDSLLVLTRPAFTSTRAGAPVLHVISVPAGELVRSFHILDVPDNAKTAWTSFLGGGVAIHDGTIAVTLPLLDSLLLFDARGTSVRRIPLGDVGAGDEVPDGRLDRAAYRAWAGQLRAVGRVFATTAGWLIPLLPVGATSSVFREALLVRWESDRPILIRDVPVVRGSDPATGEIIFDDPARLEPQYLRIGRIRTDADGR